MTDIDKFEVELRLDCTIKVGDWDFVKPGVSSKISFDTIPEYETLQKSMKFMQDGILEPTLNDVIESVHKQVNRQFGGRH